MRKPRAQRRLNTLLETANNVIEAQDNTLDVLRSELIRLRHENDCLRERVAQLDTQLDNVRADNQTQAAILRGEYRFKTGGTTNG